MNDDRVNIKYIFCQFNGRSSLISYAPNPFLVHMLHGGRIGLLPGRGNKADGSRSLAILDARYPAFECLKMLLI